MVETLGFFCLRFVVKALDSRGSIDQDACSFVFHRRELLCGKVNLPLIVQVVSHRTISHSLCACAAIMHSSIASSQQML